MTKERVRESMETRFQKSVGPIQQDHRWQDKDIHGDSKKSSSCQVLGWEVELNKQMTEDLWGSEI